MEELVDSEPLPTVVVNLVWCFVAGRSSLARFYRRGSAREWAAIRVVRRLASERCQICREKRAAGRGIARRDVVQEFNAVEIGGIRVRNPEEDREGGEGSR
jgi:hypothetical protein